MAILRQQESREGVCWCRGTMYSTLHHTHRVEGNTKVISLTIRAMYDGDLFGNSIIVLYTTGNPSSIQVFGPRQNNTNRLQQTTKFSSALRQALSCRYYMFGAPHLPTSTSSSSPFIAPMALRDSIELAPPLVDSRLFLFDVAPSSRSS